MRSLGFLVFLPLLPAIVGCPGMDSQDGVGPAGPARSFILGVEQDGRMLPIRDHQVVLKRKPFVIVVVFPVPDAVLVSASLRPDSFEAARRGEPFSAIPGFAGTRARQELFNRDKTLVVGDDVHQNWQYSSEKVHNFDSVTTRDRALFCRRTVAKYQLSGRQAEDIATIDSPAVYLVFIARQWSPSPANRPEKQREVLKIAFQ